MLGISNGSPTLCIVDQRGPNSTSRAPILAFTQSTPVLTLVKVAKNSTAIRSQASGLEAHDVAVCESLGVRIGAGEFLQLKLHEWRNATTVRFAIRPQEIRQVLYLRSTAQVRVFLVHKLVNPGAVKVRKDIIRHCTSVASKA